MESADPFSAKARAASPSAAAPRAPRLGLLEPDDLSAVAWVQGELRRSLEGATKILRRYLREADIARQSDLGAVEPAVLRSARAQLHQGVGALDLVDMPAAAQVLRAAEALVQRMISKPAAATGPAVDAVERVSFAVLDYLGRHLAGKPVSPVAMFPQYEAAMLLAGAERVHPADLWNHDATAWAEGLRKGAVIRGSLADTPRRADDATRGDMESLVLGLMREPGRNTCLRMSQLCADLAAGAHQQPGEMSLAGLWHSAAAVYEALANGLLVNDGQTKRVASRLLAQLRASARGQAGLSDRLAQDLIFFCAHAGPPTADRAAPRLEAVRRAWGLEGLATGDYRQVRLGLHDPALLASAKRRVAAAKDTWAAVAGDEQHRLSNLMEQFALVGDSLQKLFPGGDSLSHALSLAAAQTAASLSSPPPPLAMEVATAFLYVDAALEDGELDQADLPQRVQMLAERVDQVRAGQPQRPLESWMEELYRRVSDRQTMGSVVQELRSSLSEVEKQIDQYFRQPTDNAPIVGVPGQLGSMRGVLSVLGMDHASQAVLHMRDDVEALLQTEVNPQQAIKTGTFNRLADNLGALGFLIDMLSVQPQLAKALFNFDASTGSLSATMGLRERVSGFDQFDALPVPLSAPTPLVTAPPAARPLPDPAPAAPALPQAVETGATALAAPAVTPTAAPVAPVAHATAPVLARAVGDSKLQVRLQALAAEAAQPNLSDDDLLASIETVTQQVLAADRGDLARTLAAVQRGLRDSIDPASSRVIRAELVRAVTAATTPAAEPLPAERPVPAPRPTPEGGTGLEDDAEMRGIFIEEAREVIDDAQQALRRAQAASGDAAADMTTVRRAFHTLKGSSRMVGLRDFGDAAWACEQLYNVRLAQSPVPDEPLVQMTQEALAYLRAWTNAIESGAATAHHAQPVVAAADSLRLQGVWKHIAPAAQRAAAEPAITAAVAQPPVRPPATPVGLDATLAARVSNLPTAADLELNFLLPASDSGHAEPAVDVELDFDPVFVAQMTGGPASPAVQATPVAPAPVEAGMSVPFVLDGPEAPASAPTPAPVDFEFDLDGADSRFALPVSAGADVDADATRTLVLNQQPSASAGAVPEPETTELQLDDLSAFMRSADLPHDFPGAALAAPVPPAPVAPVSQAEPGIADGLATPPAPVATAPVDAVPAGPELAEPTPVPAPAPEPATPPLVDAAPVPVIATPRLSLVPPAPAPALLAVDEDENYKRIGPLRISIPLFNIFLNEADELSRRLVNELAEWSVESTARPVPESTVVLAHGLAGSAGTVGCADLSALARSLEHALMRSHAGGPGRPGESTLFNDTAEEIRRLLHQFAAGFLRDVPQVLRTRLAEHERLPPRPLFTESGSLSTDGDLLLDDSGKIDHASQADAEAEQATAKTAAEAPSAAQAVPVPVPPLEPVPQPAAAPLPAAAVAAEAPPAPPAAVPGPPLLPPVAAATTFAPTGATKHAFDDDQDIDIQDSVDPELFPIFDEEAEELLPELQARLRDWMHQPADEGPPAACMRTLHTFKGGARLSGAMRLGEMAHRLETAVERLAAREGRRAADVLPLLGRADAMVLALEALRRLATMPDRRASADASARAPAPAALPPAAAVPAPVQGMSAPVAAAEPAPAGARAPAVVRADGRPDWGRFERGLTSLPVGEERAASGPPGVRVRAALLDRLLNQAGEVTIARSRIDADVKQLQSGLGELGESLERMRGQLRDIEVQAETQISSRLEAAKAAAEAFDPLEMDRFTRLQELTRFMAESVNDVAMLQRGLMRTVQSAEDQLAAQSRLTRDLQDDLLRTRMVEFESASDRLYRTVRQAAKEAGKQVRLDIVGGAIELDRGVLERMTGPFEHLLRNCVVHGVEAETDRLAAGKPAVGQVTIAVAQSGNEVAVDIADDGAGLDLQRIRLRAIERRLLPDGAAPTESELSQIIFRPGFSTTNVVTELAGRGVGLDVVRSEVTAMGGRIETQTASGRGTRFKLLLPLTTAVTQVVMLRCDSLVVAVPSTLIEGIRRVPAREVQAAYAEGTLGVDGENLPFFWLAALLQAAPQGHMADSRTEAVVVVRSAAQRVAVHIHEVMGNQEVVVKNVGPQLARVPGLAGVTLLPSGAVALIYNPVALAVVYGEQIRRARAFEAGGRSADGQTAAAAPRVAPLVMVVDDSLTVRRATERLLVRDGYRVVTAKDGMEAIAVLAGERPVVLLSDIEMPRMDGFDLLRHVRADRRLRDLPVAMITSRIAHKHREHAAELGADHYLGKPYNEDELLRIVARYAAGAIRAGVAV